MCVRLCSSILPVRAVGGAAALALAGVLALAAVVARLAAALALAGVLALTGVLVRLRHRSWTSGQAQARVTLFAPELVVVAETVVLAPVSNPVMAAVINRDFHSGFRHWSFPFRVVL